MMKDLLTMKVAILVESKSRFHESDVKKFYDEVFSKVKNAVNMRCIGIVFGYVIYQDAKKKADELGLYTVSSYER
jgi:hypothetical protein